MKKSRRWIAIVLSAGFLLWLSGAKADERIVCNGIDLAGAEGFGQMHAEVDLQQDQYTDYQTTAELRADLQSGAFAYDLFVLNNACVDYTAVMDEGYCLDLSGSAIIQRAVERMHPVFARQCMLNGKIYAIPHTFQPNYLAFSCKALEHLGMSDWPLPASFPEFLDFLEQWLAYMKENPESDVTLLGKSLLDETCYHAHCYSAFLVDQLLENYMLQKQAAGEALLFDEEELIPLLNRCRQIGQELYLHDHGLEDPYALVEVIQTLMFEDYRFLSLRLNDSQPNLIPIYVHLYAVSATAENPALCLELMEALCENNWPMYNTYFYQDAQPLLNPDYDQEVARMQGLILDTQRQLDAPDLSAAEREKLTMRLEAQQRNRQKMLTEEKYRYLVTPSSLEIHHAYTDDYFAAMPGAFHAGDADRFRAYKQLKECFVTGGISAETLVQELHLAAE